MIKLAAAESMLVAGLVTLSALVLQEAVYGPDLPESAPVEAAPTGIGGYGPGALLLAAVLWVVIYRVLNLWGRGRSAFWLTALLTLLPHGPAIWSHNRLELYRFFGLDVGVTVFNSAILNVTLFLASLVGLAALHRIAGLRRMDRQLRSQGTMDFDRSRVVVGEALILLGLIAAALVSATLLWLLATLSGRFESQLAWSPWTVLIVGVGGSLLFASTLVLWFRTNRDAGPNA